MKREPGSPFERWTILEEYVRILEQVVETAAEGTVMVDRQGIVRMLNKAYEDILRIKREEAIGRHVTEVIDNTRLHVALKTGMAEIGHFQRIRGQDAIVQRIPIVESGEVVAAVGKVLYRNVGEFKALAGRLNLLEDKVEYYEKELCSLRGSRYTLDHIIATSPAMQPVA